MLLKLRNVFYLIVAIPMFIGIVCWMIWIELTEKEDEIRQPERDSFGDAYYGTSNDYPCTKK